jgi:hypothetical protein
MARDDTCYVARLDDPGLDEILRAWRRDRPRAGALALLPESERDRVAALQARCREAGVALAGAIFPALVVDDRFVTEGAWLLRFDEMPICVLEDAPPAAEAQAATAERLAARLRPHLEGDDPRTLMLFCDALNPSVATLLDELYLRLADRVTYTGANAGSETFQPIPCLFDGERCVEGGVLALLLSRHVVTALAHGYPVPETLTSATSTVGNRIVQIDWRPAFDVYRELARQQYGVEIDRDSFYASAVHFPFGVVRANGVILVRIPVALEADGSLFCVGEVPPNSVLTLLEAPTIDTARTVEMLLGELHEGGTQVDDASLLLFYCAGRRLHLGLEPACEEIAALHARAGARQIAGALSLGEIGAAAQWDYPLFHNAALLASPWIAR